MNREKSNKLRKEVKSLGENFELKQKVTKMHKESRQILDKYKIALLNETALYTLT